MEIYIQGEYISRIHVLDIQQTTYSVRNANEVLQYKESATRGKEGSLQMNGEHQK